MQKAGDTEVRSSSSFDSPLRSRSPPGSFVPPHPPLAHQQADKHPAPQQANKQVYKNTNSEEPQTALEGVEEMEEEGVKVLLLVLELDGVNVEEEEYVFAVYSGKGLLAGKCENEALVGENATATFLFDPGLGEDEEHFDEVEVAGVGYNCSCSVAIAHRWNDTKRVYYSAKWTSRAQLPFPSYTSSNLQDLLKDLWQASSSTCGTSDNPSLSPKRALETPASSPAAFGGTAQRSKWLLAGGRWWVARKKGSCWVMGRVVGGWSRNGRERRTRSNRSSRMSFLL